MYKTSEFTRLSVMLVAGLLPILTLSKQISIAIQEHKKRRK